MGRRDVERERVRVVKDVAAAQRHRLRRRRRCRRVAGAGAGSGDELAIAVVAVAMMMPAAPETGRRVGALGVAAEANAPGAGQRARAGYLGVAAGCTGSVRNVVGSGARLPRPDDAADALVLHASRQAPATRALLVATGLGLRARQAGVAGPAPGGRFAPLDDDSCNDARRAVGIRRRRRQCRTGAGPRAGGRQERG